MKYNLFILFFTLCLVSCGSVQISNSDIIGEWKVIDFTTDAENIPDNVLEDGRKNALQTVFRFTDDMKCFYDHPAKKKESKWKLSADGKSLIVYDRFDETKETAYVIKSFKDGVMELEQDFKGEATMVFVLQKQ